MSRCIARIVALGFVWLNCVHTGLSQGTIVYQQPPSRIILSYQNGTNITAYHPLDVDGDGSTDFTFASGPSSLGARSEGANRIIIRLDPPPNIGGSITPLPAGFLIGSGSSVDPLSWWSGFDGEFDPLGLYFNTGNSGDFLGQHAYMGIEFQRGGNTHYGWALLEVGLFGPVVGIDAWAWETRAGVPILTGAGIDSDNDGVWDLSDECSDTPAGEAVDANGCSISQLVPCDGPWKNHGEYVARVKSTVAQFRRLQLVTPPEARELVREAARSDCGKQRAEHHYHRPDLNCTKVKQQAYGEQKARF